MLYIDLLGESATHCIKGLRRSWLKPRAKAKVQPVPHTSCHAMYDPSLLPLKHSFTTAYWLNTIYKQASDRSTKTATFIFISFLFISPPVLTTNPTRLQHLPISQIRWDILVPNPTLTPPTPPFHLFTYASLRPETPTLTQPPSYLLHHFPFHSTHPSSQSSIPSLLSDIINLPIPSIHMFSLQRFNINIFKGADLGGVGVSFVFRGEWG